MAEVMKWIVSVILLNRHLEIKNPVSKTKFAQFD